MYLFADKLHEGEEYERVLDEFFSSIFDVKHVSMNAQKSGIDRVFTNRTTNISYSIEYKADSTAARTGNMFLETISVDTTNKPGWACTSCAQLLVYYIPPLDKAYLVSMLTIKTLVPTWAETYSKKPIPNDGYNTIGVLVPLTEFEQHCWKVYQL